jgi:microcystin-dependent protein
MWSGSTGSIPTGYQLCNGSNGTPDLRNRFIVGAGSGYGVGATGGSTDATLVSHSHTASTNSAGSHYHQLRDGAGGDNTGTITAGGGNLSGQNRATVLRDLPSIMSAEGSHQHTVTVDSAGSSATNANLPPYYALAYIMRTS